MERSKPKNTNVKEIEKCDKEEDDEKQFFTEYDVW